MVSTRRVSRGRRHSAAIQDAVWAYCIHLVKMSGGIIILLGRVVENCMCFKVLFKALINTYKHHH